MIVSVRSLLASTTLNRCQDEQLISSKAFKRAHSRYTGTGDQDFFPSCRLHHDCRNEILGMFQSLAEMDRTCLSIIFDTILTYLLVLLAIQAIAQSPMVTSCKMASYARIGLEAGSRVSAQLHAGFVVSKKNKLVERKRARVWLDYESGFLEEDEMGKWSVTNGGI